MGQLGAETVQALEGPLQPLQGGVEGGHQFRQFPRELAVVQAQLQVPAADIGALPDDPVQGPQAPGGDGSAQEGRQQGGKQHAQEHGPPELGQQHLLVGAVHGHPQGPLTCARAGPAPGQHLHRIGPSRGSPQRPRGLPRPGPGQGRQGPHAWALGQGSASRIQDLPLGLFQERRGLGLGRGLAGGQQPGEGLGLAGHDLGILGVEEVFQGPVHEQPQQAGHAQHRQTEAGLELAQDAAAMGRHGDPGRGPRPGGCGGA